MRALESRADARAQRVFEARVVRRTGAREVAVVGAREVQVVRGVCVRVMVRGGRKLESGTSAGAGVSLQKLEAEIRDYGAFVRELNTEIRDSCHF